MTLAITAPAPPRPGHCSRCGKVWTLAEVQGICQWCGKPSTCQQRQGSSLTIKTRRKRKQAPATGNGYDQLPEPHLTYYKVASRFNHKAKAEDTEDLLHDIILTLDIAERNNGHKPMTEAAMYRIASYTVADYWFNHYRIKNGLDCKHCSQAQRRKCKENWLYGECPKAIKIESLNKPIIDSEGNITELGDLIADDKAIDLDAWVDARTFLIGAPQRLKGIAVKLRDGERLTGAEKFFLHKWRKREQIKLL